MMTARLNLVIFGATGFTGQYAVEEVHRIAKSDKTLTWGIAGRSQSKLENIIKDLQSKTGDDLSKIRIIIADIKDEESLKEMTKQANVIINCCGPYRFYGEPVVKACVETKTNHVDISGEPAYMESMQLKYNEAAKEAGIYIVSACGFDSIPADMGVVFMEQNFKGQLNSVETYLRAYSAPGAQNMTGASIHYGTWESLVHGIAQQKELGPLRRQLYPERLPKFSPKLKARPLINKSDIVQGWFLPFPGSDRSVVMRSQRFMYDNEKKRPIQMSAYVGFPSLFTALGIIMGTLFVGMFAVFACGRKLLLKYPKFFSFGFISHEGPSESMRKNALFSMTFYGQGWDENEKDFDKPTTKTMKVKVTGHDPGYGATNIALIYSAITILKESDKMPGNGGVLPPGAAFAKTSIIENLCKSNFKFEIIE